MTRTIRASDEPIQSFEGSKIGPALDRRTFLIGAGVAGGPGISCERYGPINNRAFVALWSG